MVESYRTKMREAKDSTAYKLYSSKVDEIDQQVFSMQDDFIKKNPKSFT